MSVKNIFKSLSAFFVVLIIGCTMAIPVFADDLDGLTGGEGNNAVADDGGGSGALGDYLQSYEPLDDENMAEASKIASPVTNLIGNLVGIVTMITAAGIFLVTVFDLAYIGLPFTRGLLTSRWQLVSDEALQAVAGMGQQGGAGQPGGMAGGMGSPMGGMGSPMGGMGSPMGGMGSPMGGAPMGGQPGAQGGASVKSTITQYLKKRVVFLVIFTIASVLLTTSALVGTGVNLAGLLFKIIEKFNGVINGVNIE